MLDLFYNNMIQFANQTIGMRLIAMRRNFSTPDIKYNMLNLNRAKSAILLICFSLPTFNRRLNKIRRQ